MRQFISFFVKYPIWSNAIIVITAMAGFLSLFTMNHSFFPELQPNMIYITVAYPGASPEEIEEGIATKVEESLTGIEGIKETSSVSSENYCNVNIEAIEGTDLNILLQEVKNAVDGIISMPEGAERPIVVAQKSRGMGSMGGMVGYLTLKGPNDMYQLKDMSDKIEREFLASKDISQVSVFGYAPQIIAIDVRADDLLKYNLTFDEISQKVKTSNLDISGGTIKSNEEELYIRSLNKSTNANEIEQIVIKATATGELIKLKDVADVKFEFSDIALENYVDGQRSVSFIIKKLPSEDLHSISVFVNEYIDDFNKKNDGFEMQSLFMFSELLDQRIDMLTNNLFIGLILVCIVLGIFLSLRLSVWVAFGIPFSFLGMFFLGSLYGITINMISLFGMILVVGILVDDGIVIAENIFSHYERGKSPIQAAIDGTIEVLSSVFTSILTTIVAFGFLLFVGGQMEMMEEMAFSVIACLAFSMIEAFLILPAHLSSKKILAPTNIKWYNRIRKGIENNITKLTNLYGKLSYKMIKSYRLLVFGPVVFMGGIVLLMLYGVIKGAFFPAIPFDDISIDIAFKPGDREQKTRNFVWYINDLVNEYSDELTEQYGDTLIKYVSANIGQAQRISETGNHAGSLRVSVKENNFISTATIAQKIKERIHADSLKKLEKFTIGGDTPFGKDISISLQSVNGEELKKAIQWVKSEIEAMPEVLDLTDNSGIGNREINLKLKPKAYLLGLNEALIIGQVRQGFYGQEVQRVIIGRDEVKIWTRFPENDRNSIGDLDNLRIKTQTGLEVPLSEVANYSISRGKVAIRHINGNKEVRIIGSLYNGELSSEINQRIQKNLLAVLSDKFPDVTYSVKGQAEKAQESIQSLLVSFGLAILLILIILSLNFSSFYQARIILMVIPVGIFSALLGHGIKGIPFSIFSFLGVIGLVGILVNDAVVMLDQFNRNLKEGMDIHTAAVEAGKARFRPIILTSITTVAGLLPLIYFETSFQAQFLIPMGVSIAFGVLFGTMALIFFYPSMILYFNDMRRARYWLWRGGENPPTKMEVEPITKIQKRLNEIQDLN
ncbi:MAG: efflux RND transporter permease subunit [Flavobacteriales bacterium]|jgi:multidrug efflux pump subunit AcrB|nr:efflux RND transporter permease subunit [Flavobacteriales bacterium]